MNCKILVPWDIPEIARDVFRKAKIEPIYIHGPHGEVADQEEIREAVHHCAVVLTRGTEAFPRSLVTENPDLLGISNYGVGFSNIDLTAATEYGLPVTNTPGILTETTADLAWALLMATARRVPQAHQYTVTGNWHGPGSKIFMGLDIGPGGSNKPKTLGIIGFGRIGQAVMRRSRGFRMKVLAYDPPIKSLIEKMHGVKYRDLDDLLRESDYITIHCPLTDKTHHLIGPREFGLMKSNTVLINTARGPLIDEQALVQALKEKKIAAAGLDVYEQEPKIHPGLLELKNVVLLPHMGSATQDTRNRMFVMAAKNAIAILQGTELKCLVNPEVVGSPAYCRKMELYHLRR
jgi:glyoxylate reductase